MTRLRIYKRKTRKPALVQENTRSFKKKKELAQENTLSIKKASKKTTKKKRKCFLGRMRVFLFSSFLFFFYKWQAQLVISADFLYILQMHIIYKKVHRKNALVEIFPVKILSETY